MTVPGIQGQAAPSGDFTYAFGPGWSDYYMDLFRSVLDMYSLHFMVSFTEVEYDGTDMGDTWVQYAVSQEAMHDFVPDDHSGFTFTAYNYNWYDGGDAAYVFEQPTMQKYASAFWVMMHEVGHALGLGHPFNDVADGGSVVDLSIDNQMYTTMSYTGPKDLATPSFLDFEALSEMYGANDTFLGDDVYSLYQTRSYTIHDSAGVDAIRYYGKKDAVINLNGGTVSRVKGDDSFVGVTPGSEIENAFGGRGDDRLVANTLENYLWGGAGDDMFVFRSVEHANGDTIGAFRSGHDTLNLRGLGVDDWHFSRSRHVFYADVDGDGGWDMAISVTRGVVREDDLIL